MSEGDPGVSCTSGGRDGEQEVPLCSQETSVCAAEKHRGSESLLFLFKWGKKEKKIPKAYYLQEQKKQMSTESFSNQCW